MKIDRKWLAFSAGAVAMIAAASPVHAQATRTYVSAVGDDANPCSRTAPCKTFAGTISKTATGGEINCIDPGSFGTFTITKSITVDCSGMIAGQTASGTTGIIINAPLGSRIVLRGLSITGAPTAAPGNFGIRYLAGSSVLIEDCIIQNFVATPSAGVGISVAITGDEGRLTINNTTIANNGTAGVGGGISLTPTGTATLKVALSNVLFVNNANAALTINTAGGTGGSVSVAVEGSRFSANSGAGIAASAGANMPIALMVRDSAIVNNTSGIVATGATMTGRVGRTVITGNGTGLLVVGGASLFSYGNNELDGNPTVGAPNNGSFTGVVIPTR
jgi:hypothetical protein